EAQDGTLEAVRYVPCPVCQALMNRVNFAGCSHVIVDVCGKHGTWFDKDELRKVIEFIRGGGLDKSRAQEIAELQRQRTLSQNDRIAAAASEPVFPSQPARYDGYDIAFSVVGAALKAFLK